LADLRLAAEMRLLDAEIVQLAVMGEVDVRFHEGTTESGIRVRNLGVRARLILLVGPEGFEPSTKGL
jgi:hypothetical protein